MEDRGIGPPPAIRCKLIRAHPRDGAFAQHGELTVSLPEDELVVEDRVHGDRWKVRADDCDLQVAPSRPLRLAETARTLGVLEQTTSESTGR